MTKLSISQQEIYFDQILDSMSSHYNIGTYVVVDGNLDVEVFKESVRSSKDVFDVFKYKRFSKDGPFADLQEADVSIQITEVDFTSRFGSEESVKKWLRERINTPFDIYTGGLYDFVLIKIRDDRYWFYVGCHHLFSDGYGVPYVFLTYVFDKYHSLRTGEEKDFDYPSYLELIEKSDDYLDSKYYESDKEYWKQRFIQSQEPILQNKARAVSFRTDSLQFFFNSEEQLKLRSFCANHEISLQDLLIAILAVYYNNTTGQQYFDFSLPIHNRTSRRERMTLGLFSKLIPCRIKLENCSLKELFDDIKANQRQDYRHKQFPVSHFNTMLLAEGSNSSRPFDIIANYRYFKLNTDESELHLKGFKNDATYSKNPIEFSFCDFAEKGKDDLFLEIIFREDCFTNTEVKLLGQRLLRVIDQIYFSVHDSINIIDVLTSQEKNDLLFTFNDTAAAYPKDKTIVDLFEEQAAKTPDYVAVVFEDTQLTYRELDLRSNNLAHYLRDNYSIQPDDLIGIKQGRSEWMIVSILGVLKSGGAYVPIDPEYPQERIDYIAADTNCKVCLDEMELRKFKESQERYSNAPVASTAKSDNLIYVIYTSGSTGKPKGVMLEHRGLVNRMLGMKRDLEVEQADVFLQKTPVTFDVSVWELFLPLVCGSKLVFAKPGGHKDPVYLEKVLEAQKVSVIHFVPSMLNAALDTINWDRLKGLRHVICSGEPLLKRTEESFKEKAPFSNLHNYYGPTEASIDVTAIDLSQHPTVGNEVSIGKPVDNTRIFIVNGNGSLQPTGVFGEILIGGDQIARGYLNKEELTKEKFIPNPFANGERLYKTGDLGRWLPDGNVEFGGRKDDQVKIRGYRIELGEIEHALLNHEEIKQAVVLPKENASGEKELVAYITSNIEQNTSRVRAFLKERLPAYMLPAAFVQVEAMPLTASGKIDKKSLPDPEGLGLSGGGEYVAPRNETEEKLVKIWEEVLQKKHIGVLDDFFALGGHSLKVVRLSNEYQKELAVKLALQELFTHTSIGSHAALIESSTREAFVEIEKVIPQASYFISDGQRRLWVLSQFEGGAVAYNMPGSLKLNGKYELALFEKSFHSLIDRHEILRTVFREDKSGEIRQWVLQREDLGFEIDYEDFRKETNKKEKAEGYIAADAYRPFDLAKGPLLRAALLQVEEEQYVFYFNTHHIISDGWSMEVLSKDVFKYYESYKAGKEPEIKELRIQYKDYSAWQLAQLDKESFKAHKAYWVDKLSGELPLLDLPRSRQRPQVRTYSGHGLATYLDKATTAKLKAYTQEKGGSLFMGLLASWNVLMYRYTSQTDIIIGTPVVGRDHADLEDQIGFYVNMLALRNKIDPEESFDNFYQALKEDTFKSYRHQMYPFDRLVNELNLQRDTSRSAVFDVLLDFHNHGDGSEGFELSKEEINQIVDRGYRTSKFDIEVIFQENGDHLSLESTFNTDVYEKSMVEGLIRHYKQLLNALLETPEEKISTLDYLSDDEKHTLLVTFNDTAVAYPKDRTIIDLFEDQAAKTPDNTAVVFRKKQLTYRELNEKSNQLAHYLRDNHNIQPDQLIGIQLGRSEWMIISILGVLKAGGAYVPIDPEYPSARKEYIVKDSSLNLLITEASFIYDIDYYDGQVFAIDVEFDSENYSSEEPTKLSTPGNLAYVMYTSGSTGKPKGVMVAHGSLINYLECAKSKYSNRSSHLDFGLFTSLSFDLTVTSIYLPLISGEELNIFDNTSDVSTLIKEYFERQITCIKLTPAHIRLLGQLGLKSTKVQVAIVGGDKLENTHVGILRELNPAIRIYNEYGPTESTVGCSIKEIGFESEAILIGYPIANTQIYLLNEKEQLQPVEVIGEICIGGAGLAQGYLNQPVLTAEKFIANPFKAGERLYRSGDLGRWRPDGNIEYLGRMDDQLKIRGHRIELGEIEHALEQNKEINQGVVLAKENESGEKELVAYITSNVEQNSNDLRAYLKETLPAYMLPAYFVQLEAMPLTANGKIDKRSLPNAEGLGLTSGVEYVAPSTEQEKVLISVWSDVLKRSGIGIKDSFYNLGGDSIKSIQVVARLKQHGYRLKVEHLLRTPVLEELARLMELTSQLTDQSEVSGEVVLTPIQEWFFKTPEIKEHDHYNQSVLLCSKEALDRNVLEKSIEDLTRHHDVLRMVYKHEQGTWQQFNQDTRSKHYTIDFYDLRESIDAAGQMVQLGEEQQSSIKLSEGPLLRVLHFRLEDGDRLGLIIHHLVVDGVSWRILLEDLSSLYTGYKEGEKPGLPLKTDSFQRWALLQKEYAGSKKLKRERTYWQKMCDQQIAGLPQDKAIKEGQAAVIDSAKSFRLNRQTTALLQTRVHGVYNTEINDVLLTSFGLALKEVLSVGKSVLKMEGHGREEIIDGVDISRTVGWFTTVYPFVLDVSNSSSLTESLVNVKEGLRRVPNKGIGYGILTYLNGEGIESKLTPQITFNYLGDFGSNVSNDKDSLFEYASELIGSDISQDNETNAILDVSGMLVKGELGISIRYSKSRYHAATIQKLAASYKKNLEVLIEALAESKEKYLTPSDLTFKGLSQEELSRLNSDNTLEDVYELSPLQEGIYYHWLAEDSSTVYFEQAAYRVQSNGLAIEKLKRAYDRLTYRHAVLRTSFSTEYAGRSLQIVRKGLPSNFKYEKLDRQEDQQVQVELIKKQDREKGFDLSSGSQMRLHVVDLSEGRYEFIWSYHHILMDGWCMSVLINDFNKLLSAEINGSMLERPPITPYSSYIRWLREIDTENSLRYWKDYLSGYSSLAHIPFKRETADSTYVESSERLQIRGDLFKKVDALCNQLGITHNTFVQGVWGYLLSRYNNTNDVVFGAVVSGRPADLPGVEDMIGLFINAVPVRVKYDPDDTPAKLLKSLQDQSIQISSDHYMNLSEVQSQSELGMDLIDHIMIFENYAVKELETGGALNSEGEEGLLIESKAVFARTNYDFNIVINPTSASLEITISYNFENFDTLPLKRLISHFDKLITAFAENGDRSLNTIDYLSEEEQYELLYTFNNMQVAYPKDKTAVDLFEEQVVKTPNKIALVFEGKEISYQELNERSNQLAHYLKDNYKIKPDDLVGFQLPRNENLIIVILAILKAGGAYIPIEIDSPEERIVYIIKDSKCLLIIDESKLDLFITKSLTYQKTSLPKESGPHNLIYVVYTSGSTGLPKGVLIEHRSIVTHIFNVKDLYGVSAESRFLQFFNIAFDAAAQEIFTSLSFGATLYIKTSKVDPEYIFALISKYKITHADFSTAFFNSFIATLNPESFTHQLEFCAIGGEKVEKGVLEKQWHNISNFTKKFYNVYGPTETTLTATWFPIMAQGKLSEFDDVIPIGKSYAGRQVLILDANERLLPIGIPGEICIGGNGLARGYLNREELTKERFIANPFMKGERLYKTGDLGRWLPDGNIEFIGRNDDQVKIRGHRIELGEIEHALEQHKDINQAIVLTKERPSGEKELVAYVTSNVEQSTNDLRAYLKEKLPAYMLPAYFVQLQAMPLTANGKIDKKSLPDPEGLELVSGVEYVAPRTEREMILVSVWSDVLKREGIGIKDSFYNLGGDSIKSIQVVARLKQHGYRLKVEHILRTPVLEDLAPLMELTTQLTDQREVSGEVVLTPIQEWFFKAPEIKKHDHFNQSVLLYSKGRLDSEILEKCIDALTRHHDVLRMVYKHEQGTWQQFNQDTRSKHYTIDFYDLRESIDAAGQMAQLGEELQSSIKLTAGPLLRALHFRLKDGDRLGLIIHHLMVDGVSWRILLEDLSSLYTGYKEGEKPGLPLKTDSFQRWALLQKEYAGSKKLAKERTYWQDVCDQQIAGLPQDKVVKENQSAILDSGESFHLNKQITALLQTRVHGVYNTEINDVLLTSLGLALKEVLSVEKSVLKLEGHGREEIIAGVDISRTVGWFTTVYPFVLDVSNSSNQSERLVRVKEALRSVPNKGIGYGILTHLSGEGIKSKLTSQIAFNYLGDFGSNVSNDEDSLFEYASEHIGSDISQDNETDAILDVSGMLVKGELGISMRYSKSRYHSTTVKNLAASYKKNLESLIEALAESKEKYLTPSDLSFKGLSIEELSKLNSDNTLEDVYELSPLQEGIYYHWLAEDSSLLYFEQTSCRVRAKVLDIDKLKRAYDHLISRHAVLRTSFSTEYAGRSLQIVRKEVSSNFTYEKLDRRADRHKQVELIKKQDRKRGFDLSSGSQMRLHVIDLSEGEYEFIWSHHHILIDGWCMSVLINDLNKLLSAGNEGRDLQLAQALPYCNYINWLRTIDRESSLSYWKDYLSGYSASADIPFKADTADSTYVESSERLQIGGELFKKVDALCTQLGITHNTFVQGVWGYLLSRYNNTNDVVFGAVVSGRPADLPGVEDMIGLFINTIPVRVKYDTDDTPLKLLKELQEQSIQSSSHHYMSLSEVLSQSELGKNLIGHIMAFENYAVKQLESEGALNAQGEGRLVVESTEVFEQANYNFSITVYPASTFITVTIKYNRNYYSTPLIGRIKNHFNSVVNRFVDHPNQALSL